MPHFGRILKLSLPKRDDTRRLRCASLLAIIKPWLNGIPIEMREIFAECNYKIPEKYKIVKLGYKANKNTMDCWKGILNCDDSYWTEGKFEIETLPGIITEGNSDVNICEVFTKADIMFEILMNVQTEEFPSTYNIHNVITLQTVMEKSEWPRNSNIWERMWVIIPLFMRHSILYIQRRYRMKYYSKKKERCNTEIRLIPGIGVEYFNGMKHFNTNKM
jgi:hypothetical protein